MLRGGYIEYWSTWFRSIQTRDKSVFFSLFRVLISFVVYQNAIRMDFNRIFVMNKKKKNCQVIFYTELVCHELNTIGAHQRVFNYLPRAFSLFMSFRYLFIIFF